jgi:hypothetical protein
MQHLRLPKASTLGLSSIWPYWKPRLSSLLYVSFTEQLDSLTKILTFDQQILAVLIIGERNLASAQVGYQTEPMSSIGTFRLSSPNDVAFY